MGVFLTEQETVVNIIRTDKRADIYTSDYYVMRKLDRKVEESDAWKLEEEIRDREGEIVAKRYSCPKKLVQFRTREIKRELTDEQRAELAERLRRYRKQNKD